jgi:hypothetical protein
MLKVETIRNISHEDGWAFKIAPGEFGCIELSLWEEGECKDKISIPPEAAKLVAEAICQCEKELGEIL